MSLFEEIPAMSPVQFFSLSADCHYVNRNWELDKKYLLPETSDLIEQNCFAQLYAGWNMEKMCFLLDAEGEISSSGEDFRKTESLELFIDTRDFKSKSVPTRFCHHFVFFPVLTQSFYGREITRFRGDDMHRLCHPEDLQVSVEGTSKGYRLWVEIQASCLHGYDPIGFPRIGFTYQVNRRGGSAQYFSVSSEEYVIEQHPATWGTLHLVREE